MKKIPLILMVALLSTGCNKFRSLYSPEHHDAHHDELPASYTISGTTVQDYQLIQPVRVEKSNIEIRVKAPGATAFRVLNPFEVIVSTGNVYGGTVRFQNKCDAAGGSGGWSIINYGVPVAPPGTYYEITSTLVGS